MINGQSIKSLVESVGVEETTNRLGDLMSSGEVKPEDFSVRELAESFCGYEWVQRLNPRNTQRYSHFRSIMEAGEGVDVTAFSHVTGQIIFSKIQQGWDQVGMIGDRLFETVPTVFDGERVPGIGRITGVGGPIRPGMPYPEAGFGEQYWDTPATTKHGMIVSLTKETIFFDRTSLVTRRAGEIGKMLRYNKEERQLACAAGITVALSGSNETFSGNNHKWNGTTYNTYQTGANAIGINAQSATPLVDWTTINTALQLFNVLLDPDTNRPILIAPTVLLVQPANLMLARRIVRATDVRATSPGFATSGNVQQTTSYNPVENYEILTSPLLRQMLVNAPSSKSAAQADAYWYLMEPKKAFWYMENWPLTTVQSPANSIKEFEQDLVLRWKSSERGVPWVADPRYVVNLWNT